MTELVSVVMPVFDANPDFIRQSVMSILSQTYDDLELIVVFDKNDRRTDDPVGAVLEEFHDDHRLRVSVNSRRLGFTHSLNKGMRLASGDYIARMDCDDISSSSRIEEQMETLVAQRLDIVGCWAFVIDEKGRTMGCLSPPSSESAIRKHLLFHNPFLHSTILFRRRMTDAVGHYKPSFETAEDYEFYLRAFSKGYRGANAPRYLHSLREHASSMIRGSRWKENRVAYLKCKLTGVFRYHLSKPLDVIYLGATPLCFLIDPSKVLPAKRIFGFYRSGNLSRHVNDFPRYDGLA